MRTILRSFSQAVKGLATGGPCLATTKELFARHPHVLFRRTSTQQPRQHLRDHGLPNPSWSREMMGQFEKFTKMSEDGSWQRIPSYNNILDSIPVYRKAEYNAEKLKGTLLFVRNVATEGRGFEFAMFFNGAEKRTVVLLQPGLYLEGMIGFMHGGAMAAILDHTFASCAICALGVGMTASLSINYKSPIPLGSVVLVETKVEKMEEKKAFMSGGVRSADGRHVHAEATALFIKLDMKNPK
ncbi:acyl-coenzyme A thioesterase THEM4-like isoform 2-T2 [Liasis olivaceus]